MKLEFIVNKYLLMWHLLYETSINDEVDKIKQSLWKNQKMEYSKIHKEKNLILNDLDNYIPDDDIIFNKLETSEVYKKIKQETNRYKLNLLETWGNSRRSYQKELNKLLKCELEGSYTIGIIHPSLNIVEVDFNLNFITLGKKIDNKDKDSLLTYLLYKIIKNEVGSYKPNEKDITSVVLELVCLNELYTKMTHESKYNIGKKELKDLKNKIYPYFLMYLGIDEKDMEKCMIRDNIFFDIDSYPYNYNLKMMDIFSFINYIVKNKEEVLSKKSIGVEKIKIETL